MKKIFKAIALSLATVFIASSVFACKPQPEENKNNGNVIKRTDIMLLENGKSDYKIVVPKNATAPEKFAAEELKNIFFNSSGVNLPIDEESAVYTENDKIIAIGNTAFSAAAGVTVSGIDFNYDGYMIKRKGNAVIINAKEETGKINGVYGFAERNLGYRYYAQDCVKYEKATNVALYDFDLIDVPDFQGRISFSAEIIADGLHRLRMKNNNQGTNWSQKYGNSGLWSILHDQSIPMQILNAAKYYGEHKDWYYVAKGREKEAETLLIPSNEEYSYQGDVWTLIKEAVQICYHKALASKGEAGGLYETFLNNLIHDYIEKEPEKSFFMLGMADNLEVCDCDDCSKDNDKYTVTGTCMRFVNEVARDVEKWRLENCPERQIDLVVFAYLTTQDAPVKRDESSGKYAPSDNSVIAEDNVIVRIAPIFSCHYYPFSDKNHNIQSANMIEQWRMCAKKFAIWDYKMSFEYKIVPFPTWNSAQKNLKTYKEMGVIDVLTQGNGATFNTSLGRMDDYIRSRLMWDTDLSYQALADEFIEVYYGAASGYMKEYLSLLEMHFASYIAKISGFDAKIYNSLLTTSFWPKETLINIENVFRNAYAAIENSAPAEYEALKERIDRESAFYRFALIELYGNDVYTSEQLKAAIEEYAKILSVSISLPYKNESAKDRVQSWKKRYNID